MRTVEARILTNGFVTEMLHRSFKLEHSRDIDDLKGRTVSEVRFNAVNNKVVIYTYDGLTLEIILD